MAMRSCNKGNRFCDVEAALFAMNFDVNMVKNVILENPNKDYASVLLCESYKKKDEHLLDLAKWVAYHPDVSQDLVKDIVKYRNGVTIDVSDNVNSVRARISRGRAVLEIQAIENAYLDFKFADCKCNLPKTEVELGDYKAYIMDAQDPRQVMIGYDTDCCQHLGGEGETAMMYGLVNPDAGFFVIEDKRSGKILAQAETWQTADGEKLVFDNIEFADDRKVNQFAPVLAKWCEKSPYPDILMGNGYNEMINDSIHQFEGMTPPLTGDLLATLDSENIVSSLENTYGEKYPSPCDLYEAIAAGEVNTKDLLEEIAPYTDADESCSVLKYSNSVELYFQEAYDKPARKVIRVLYSLQKISLFFHRFAWNHVVPHILVESFVILSEILAQLLKIFNTIFLLAVCKIISQIFILIACVNIFFCNLVHFLQFF